MIFRSLRHFSASGPDAPIHGYVAPGFEPVEDEFRRNFQERDEIGAACAVYHKGQIVVDLWGGWRNPERTLPWEQDTLVLMFSVSKGMAAVAVGVALSRNLFSLDEPVSTYWPEFASRGKARVTVRQLLAHRAGLAALDVRLTPEILADQIAFASVLASQHPHWEPGTRHGYHILTLGWYESELIRRTDSQHRTLGQFFHDEVAVPLGIEFYFGTSQIDDAERLASLQDYNARRGVANMHKMPARYLLSQVNPASLTFRAVTNPWLRSPGGLLGPEYSGFEIPSANGIGVVRDVARVYGELAVAGTRLGIVPDVLEEFCGIATVPPDGDRDVILRMRTRYAMGFSKPGPDFRFGSSPHAFGTSGLGGALGFADPAAQIGFAYAPNRLDYYMWNDPRQLSLRKAVYESLGLREGGG